jgi:hypothetical protein
MRKWLSVTCQRICLESVEREGTYGEGYDIYNSNGSHGTPNKEIQATTDYAAKDVVTETANAHFYCPSRLLVKVTSRLLRKKAYQTAV